MECTIRKMEDLIYESNKKLLRDLMKDKEFSVYEFNRRLTRFLVHNAKTDKFKKNEKRNKI